MAILVINYTRYCARCHKRHPIKGFRRVGERWLCPECAFQVLGPPQCCFCGGEVQLDQPRVRMSDHKIAHRGCYFDAAVHEGV